MSATGVICVCVCGPWCREDGRVSGPSLSRGEPLSRRGKMSNLLSYLPNVWSSLLQHVRGSIKLVDAWGVLTARRDLWPTGVWAAAAECPGGRRGDLAAVCCVWSRLGCYLFGTTPVEKGSTWYMIDLLGRVFWCRGGAGAGRGRGICWTHARRAIKVLWDEEVYLSCSSPKQAAFGRERSLVGVRSYFRWIGNMPELV